MKKILLVLIVSVMGLGAIAQNIQTHYDMGKDRGYLTTTVEMFKPDKYGSTFFFIDMDYSSDTRDVDNGISSAYWEIARAFKWNENQKYMPRVEYNGGVFKLNGEGTPFIPVENCWLAGVERTWASADFSKIFTFQVNYKNIKDKEDASFQLTAVWTVQMADGKFTFSGFADFWKEEMDVWFDDMGNKKDKTDFRFLTEPQIWYNASKHLSLGGEVELSNNFVADEFKVMPTIAAKWTF